MNKTPKLVEHNLMVILTQYLDGEADDYGLRRRALNAVELLAHRVEIALNIFRQYYVSNDILSGNPQDQIRAMYTTWLKDNSLSYQPIVKEDEEYVSSDEPGLMNRFCLTVSNDIDASSVANWLLSNRKWFKHHPSIHDPGKHYFTISKEGREMVVKYCAIHGIEVK